MKHCPRCKTDYTDETLIYCLSDGTVLNTFEIGKKTVRNNKSNVNKTGDDFEKYRSLDTISDTKTEKFTQKVEKKRSGLFWKITTFGLFGILIILIASFWLVFPERFQALSSSIPFPDFSSGVQKRGNRNRKWKIG